MTLAKRLVVCLDVRGDRVVKGTQFVELRDVGDAVALAEAYGRDGADEIVFLDIAATAEERATMLETSRRVAERLFVPLTIGGGIRSADDVGRALRAGADKVSVNSAAVARPELITEAAQRFGSQCVVASIDAKTRDGGWTVCVNGGRRETERDVVAWAAEAAERGAGEILLTSIDRDGGRRGYDLELTSAVARAVDVPVVASGGAGSARDVADVLGTGGADAALVAGMLHDGTTTVHAIKRLLRDEGINIRESE